MICCTNLEWVGTKAKKAIRVETNKRYRQGGQKSKKTPKRAKEYQKRWNNSAFWGWMPCKARRRDRLRLGQKGATRGSSNAERTAQQNFLRRSEPAWSSIPSQTVRLGENGKHRRVFALVIGRSLFPCQTYLYHMGWGQFSYRTTRQRLSRFGQSGIEKKQMENPLPPFCPECARSKPYGGLLVESKKSCP